MLIYANGDSFTAGNELVYEDLDSYPGNLMEYPHSIPEEIWEWINHSEEKNGFRADEAYYSSIEKSKAYPHLVGTHFNAKIVNNAKGGSSFERVARISLFDLLTLRKKYPKEKIIALVGIVGIGRVEIPSQNKTKDIVTGWTQMQMQFEASDIAPEFRKWHLLNNSDYHMQNALLRDAIQLYDFCKNNDIDIVFVTNHEKGWIDIHLEGDYEDIAVYEEYLFTAPIFSMRQYSERCKKKGIKSYSILGHYANVVHVEMAKDIVTFIEQNFL